MRLHIVLSLAMAILSSNVPTVSAAVHFLPRDSHHTTTTSTSVAPIPTVLLPPRKFSIKIVKQTHDGIKSMGFITLPPAPSQGALIHVTPSASPFYFKQKIGDGQGITFSTPDFFTVNDFALSYSFADPKAQHSKVYLSNLLDNGASGLNLIDMKAVRMFGDQKSLYFTGIGVELGGTSGPVVFSLDESTGELWVGTKDWKFPTVYLQIIPNSS